ncbi:MAG: hypothetical protein MI757_12680, partial [Pirellulales bacterium]|nr:hypothetical protein [Pirellulales bacterium]
TVEPVSGSELSIEFTSHGGAAVVRESVSAGSATPGTDPFAHARQIIDGLRERSLTHDGR